MSFTIDHRSCKLCRICAQVWGTCLSLGRWRIHDAKCGPGMGIRNRTSRGPACRTWYTSTGTSTNIDLPYNDYYDYFSPTYTLTVPANNMENLNSREYLHKIMSIVLENIKRTGTGHAPGVQMQNVPRDREDDGSEEDERREMEERRRENKIGKLWHNGSFSTSTDLD